jgi:release factor glutamine methyltransferase
MRNLPEPPRVDALVRWAAARLVNSPSAQIDARALAKAAFRLDDAGLIVDSAKTPPQERIDAFVAMVARRMAHEPVAYIVGVREFWSLEFELAPGILVPRTDSETIIEAVIARRDRATHCAILDLGCGSGALLCALLTEFKSAVGVGVDIHPAAVEIASRNIRRLGLADRAKAVESDWTAAVEGRFDIVVANPPYIPASEQPCLPEEVRDYESPLALFGGNDGLDAYRSIMTTIGDRLAQDALLVFEFGHEQASLVNAIAREKFPNARFSVENDLESRPRALAVDLRACAH